MKKSTILLLLAAAVAALVVVICPLKLPVSDQATRDITDIVQQKYPTQHIVISPISLISVRAESFDPTTKGSGSTIYYLRRGFSGWKITDTIYSIE